MNMLIFLLGEKLQELKHSLLPRDMGDPSIRGNQLVVPDWYGGKLLVLSLDF